MRELKLVARYPEVLQLEIGLRGLINGGMPEDLLGRENVVEDIMRRIEAVMHAELVYLQGRDYTDFIFDWERRQLSILCDVLMEHFSPAIMDISVGYNYNENTGSGFEVMVVFDVKDPETEKGGKTYRVKAPTSPEVKKLLIEQLDKLGLRKQWLEGKK